jgi:apolipoprotein N-acyltransferase
MGDDRHRGSGSGVRPDLPGSPRGHIPVPASLGGSTLRAPALRAAALGAGALAGGALPPLGFPPLLWLALAVLWWLTAGPAPGVVRGGTPGLFWGLAAVLVSHRWLLWLHPLDWVGVPGPLSLPLCLLLWGLCGLAGGALVQLWSWLVRRADPWQPATAMAAACAWGLAEVALARGPLFWIGLGGASLPGDPPLAGLAAYGGAGAVAAVQVLLGWCLWRLLASRSGRRRWLALSLTLLLLSHGLGLLALARAATAEGSLAGAPWAGGSVAGAEERLLLLQPAIPTREKFAVYQQRRLLDRLRAAGRRAAALPAAQAVQSLLLPEGSLLAGQALPEAAPVEVLSGGFRRQGEGLRSSLLRFPPGALEPVAWVDKQRVVPLGEWVPLAGLFSWTGLSAVGGVEPGAPGRLLARPAGAIGVAICYEIADGRALVRASREGALWLLASANLDPYPALLRRQFLALARLRAIESGRWLVSVANTGPSGVVDAAGRVRQLLPEVRGASVVVRLQPRHGLTPYARFGEGPLLVALALALLASLPRWLAPDRPAGDAKRRALP